MKSMVFAVALAAAAPALAGKPDLTPDFDPATGLVTIRNSGAGAVDVTTYVAVGCQRLSPAVNDAGDGCPAFPKAFVAQYANRQAPGRAVFSIGYLAPGATATHKLAFWPYLAWSMGRYRIDVTVDVSNKVFETSEDNNKRSFWKTVAD
jgi:hypothetical protein